LDEVLDLISSVGKWLRREFTAAWPVFLYFLAGLLLLLVIIKLALVKFSIEVTALSQAIVGALLAAKAVLILDETSLSRRLESYRKIVAVSAKTLLYGAISLLLGYLERILEALHKTHSFGAATRYVIEQASLSRLMAWALGVTILFAIYFAFFEIDEHMGKGKLRELFFEASKPAGGVAGRSAVR
jgi:hypothetical protein